MEPSTSPLGPPPAPGLPLDTRLGPALRSPASLHGLFCGLPLPALVEMAAFAGFDFVVIDNEHGPAGFETTEHMLRAARASVGGRAGPRGAGSECVRPGVAPAPAS